MNYDFEKQYKDLEKDLKKAYSIGLKEEKKIRNLSIFTTAVSLGTAIPMLYPYFMDDKAPARLIIGLPLLACSASSLLMTAAKQIDIRNIEHDISLKLEDDKKDFFEGIEKEKTKIQEETRKVELRKNFRRIK